MFPDPLQLLRTGREPSKSGLLVMVAKEAVQLVAYTFQLIFFWAADKFMTLGKLPSNDAAERVL